MSWGQTGWGSGAWGGTSVPIGAPPSQFLYSEDTCDVLFGSKKFVVGVRWNGVSLAMGSIIEVEPLFALREGSISYVTPNTLTWSSTSSDQVLLYCHDGTDLYVRRNGVELARVACALGALPAGLFHIGKAIETQMDGAIRQIVAWAHATEFPSLEQILDLEAFLAQ